MSRTVLILILLTVSGPLSFCARRRASLRVVFGVPDIMGKYPYVVVLVSKSHRQCTGTLISSEWVLTAAHCIACEDCYATHIQYGNMTLLPNSSETKNQIIQQIRHPGYGEKQFLNDIGLLRVEPVPMKVFGKLSAVDYGSLIGRAVEYAGYGTTQDMNADDDRRMLIIGEGVITTCDDMSEDFYSMGPYVCVAPKCSNRRADSAPGDSGAPLFYDQKIVALVGFGDDIIPVGGYTAISPFITWIHEVMTSNRC